MKRVLVISYYWPPSGGSGVQRWMKFCQYLPQAGWQPVIYTPENPELIATDPSLEQEIPEEVEVIRRPIFEPYGIYRKLTGAKKKGGSGKGEVNPINAQKKSLGQKVSMFIRGNFFIPDPRCMWIGPSFRWLKKYLKAHPVDVLVSTGPPHSMHLIARKLSLATGIPWIADFRDPWTKMFYFKHLNLSKWVEKRHHRLEQQVLDDATAIVAVTPLVRKDFMEMTRTPVYTITNGYDEQEFTDAGTCRQTDRFVITHTGFFAADGNPTCLWKVLADLCRENPEFAEALEIRLVGKTDQEVLHAIMEAGLETKVNNMGYCAHSTAVSEQKQATVLILPLRKEPELKACLPGKLFEYLAACRPILGIGQKDGAMAEILEETRAGITCDWEEYDEMKAWLEDGWKQFRTTGLKCQTRGIENYSRRATARQMVELLDRLSAGR